MNTSVFGTISLIAFTIGFLGLVFWAYSPARKERLQRHGRIPLEDEPESSPEKEKDAGKEKTDE